MDIRERLKRLIIDELDLEGLTPEEIDNEAPLFGEGLELDSLDAVEFVVIVKKYFGVEIKDMEEAIPAFQSINALAEFIQNRTRQ